MPRYIHMLKRSNRFHGRGSLQVAYARGKSVRGPLFSLKFMPRRHGELRAAVVVSTKVSKKAPVRNRIRRRLYELIRLRVDAAVPMDMVITVYSETAAGLAAADLTDQFVSLCRQAQVPLRPPEPKNTAPR